MQHPTHNEDMNLTPSACAPAVARFSPSPSSPVYLPESFCFPLFCTHTQQGSHTFFLPFPFSICISEPCNETSLFSLWLFWKVMAILYSSYDWLLQLRLLFPTGANNMHLLWTFPQPPRHDPKILYKSVHNYSPVKVLPGIVCILWDNCNVSPLQPIQLWPTAIAIKSCPWLTGQNVP